jgi:hypothetical protein
MTYEIKYITHKGSPFNCKVSPKKIIFGLNSTQKEYVPILTGEVQHRQNWFKVQIPVKDILEFDNKSVEEVQIVRPLSTRAVKNVYTLNIFLDNQENVIGMEMSA